jgi:hypothetical protein
MALFSGGRGGLCRRVARGAPALVFVPPVLTLLFFIFVELQMPSSRTGALGACLTTWKDQDGLALRRVHIELTWKTALYVVTSAWAVAWCGFAIWRRLRQRDAPDFRPILVPWLACLLPALAYVLFSNLAPSNAPVGDPNYRLIAVDVYDALPPEIVALISKVLLVSNISVAIGVSTLVATVASLAPEFVRTKRYASPRLVEQDARRLAALISTLKVVLFAASALLVLGMLVIDAWTSVPLTLAGASKADCPGIVRLEAVIGQYRIFQAAMFSLLLVSVFLPMALWLRDAAVKLDRARRDLSPPHGGANWLEENGLALSLSGYWTRGLALLAPLLGEAATRLATALN